MSHQLSSKSAASPTEKRGRRRNSKESTTGSPQSQVDAQTRSTVDDGGQCQGSNEKSINRHQFWRFIKDAGLLNPHLAPGECVLMIGYAIHSRFHCIVLCTADVDHVLLRVCRFDGMSIPRRDSNTVVVRPPDCSLPRRSISMRGRRGTLIPQDAEASTAPKASDRIEEQLKIQAKLTAKRVVKHATTHVTAEQFVEAVVRLAGYHPSSLGTGLAVP